MTISIVCLVGITLAFIASTHTKAYTPDSPKPSPSHTITRRNVPNISPFWNDLNFPLSSRPFNVQPGVSRIIGGKVSKKPFTENVVAILIRFKDDPSVYSCTGSVLDEEHVLTAAHCFHNQKFIFNPNYVRVNVGPSRSKGPFFTAKKVNIWKRFNPKSSANDIAIITISGKFPRFKPVHLPSKFELRSLQLVHTAGFGVTSRDGTKEAARLREVKQRHFHYKRCVRVWRRYKHRDWSESNMVCASNPEFPNLGSKHSCFGDSGGPLFTKEKIDGTLVMVQHGITSWGPRICGFEGFPTWYTNVATFTAKIRQFLDKGWSPLWQQVLK